jgi:hypothetical protein
MKVNRHHQQSTSWAQRLGQLLATVAAVGLASTGQAQLQFNDDFEGYADQTAFSTAWSTANTALTLTTTNRSRPGGTNSVFQGTAAASSYKALTASINSSKLYYRAYFYDAGASRSFCRVEGYSGGTYGSSVTQILAIGRYNNIAGNKYYGRMAYGATATGEGATAAVSSWFQLGGAANTSSGWHKAEIVGGLYPIGTSDVRIRYYIDGVLGGCAYQSADRVLNFAVLGSGLSLTGTGQWFDDVVAEALQMIPEILTQPAAQTVNELEPVTFTVVATNSVATNTYALNTLKYQWQFNDVDIIGATNSSYSIGSAGQSTHQGNYRCIVTDAYGSQRTLSEAAYLTVNAIQLPVIDTPPVGAIINPGGSVTFTVAAHGDAPLYYTWCLYGTNVAYTGTDNTYTINGLSTNDSGPYTCVVTNNAGAATSSPPAILVVNLPPALTSATNQSIAVNTKAAIRMHAIDDVSSESTLFQDFDTYGNGYHVMFCQPSFSGTTAANIDGSQPNFSYVTNGFPTGHASSRVLNSRWTWTNNPPGSLRLTTSSTSGGVPYGGNPIISYTNRVRFDLWCDRDLKVGLGVRDTSPTGAIGATDPVTSGQMEWIGVSSSSPTRTVPAEAWTTLDFDPLSDTIQNAYGVGNGVLDSTTGKGQLEHLYLVASDNQPNAYKLYLDNFVVVAYRPITFKLESGPVGATIDEYSGLINWTPTALGPSEFTVTATDYLSLTSTKTFTVTAIMPLAPVTITNVSGGAVAYSGGSGSQFVLLESANLHAQLSTWTRVATNAATPGSFPVSNASGQSFYRVKSE